MDTGKLVNHSISPKVLAFFVSKIEDAVGDAIKQDIKEHQLMTQNSTASRIWDFLNTSIILGSDSCGCTSITSNRGPWEMVIAYDPESRYVITLMREKRFEEIRRQRKKRKTAHYLDAFSKHLNSDLCSPNKQMFLFEQPQVINREDAAIMVEKMMKNFELGADVIGHHALILFDSSGFQLTQARLVVIDAELDIVYSESLLKYISAQESVIVDSVGEKHNAYNNPTHGLSLTKKAASRKEIKLKKSKKEEDQAPNL